MPLLCLPFILILLSILGILRNRSTRSYQEKMDAFWERERQANHVRRQDISNLDYIRIPLEDFPIGQFSDKKLAECEETLQSLQDTQILNLSGISNTDLKLKYGAANLPVLSECDTRFTVLARTLLDYGKQLNELGHPLDAIPVLEFGIQCKTDVSTNYTLLAKLYSENGLSAKIPSLVHAAEGLDSLMKDSILRQLYPLT